MFGREDREDRDYRDQRSDYGRGDGYPAGGNVTHGGGYPAGAGVPRPDDDDFRGAAEVASRHAGDSGDSGLFGSILSSLSQNKHQVAQGDIDEDAAVRHHQQFFGGGDDNDGQQADNSSMGAAAAMQALKLFSGGGSGGGGAQSQSQFVALAMAEASKLFDRQASQGKVAGGASKESAVQQAGEMALKMYLKSQGGGSSSGGGMSSLLGVASKFL